MALSSRPLNDRGFPLSILKFLTPQAGCFKLTKEEYESLRFQIGASKNEQSGRGDGKTAYYIGASKKDAGRKCFAISYMEDPVMISGLINRLKTI